jgi:NAD(P)-dependent dehydrogenase (short-subunit alcohol dehydrogenase family)
VALITGGNGGIGLGMAEALAQAGADLMIWGTNPAKNADAEAKLRAHGRRVESRVVDVGDEAMVAATMAETVEVMGRIDSCFANAGINHQVPSFLEMDTESWQRMLRINLDGAMWTMREACRHMVERAKAGDAGGSIVGISSMVTRFGSPRNQHYAAAKHGLLGVVEGIAVEFARYGIRANSVLPGWTSSGLSVEVEKDENFTNKVISRVPMRRWGRADEFGGIAVYLASPASSFHTGDSILIDGGYALF